MPKIKPCLSASAALERLDDMLPRVVGDIRHTVVLEGAMEGANDVVLAIKAERGHLRFETAGAFEILQNAQALNLALAISRLFDPGSRHRFPRDHRDVASIPALMWLLRRGGCPELVLGRSAGWMGGSGDRAARSHLHETRRTFARFCRSMEGRAALSTLRQFRNKLLAHNLMAEIEGEKPSYSDLFLLTKLAAEIGSRLELLVRGANWNPGERRKIDYDMATRFWRVAFTALADSDEA